MRFPATLALALLILGGAASAQDDEYAVDQADSADFEDFHSDSDKDNEVTLFGKGGLLGTRREPGINVFNRELDNPLQKGTVVVDDLSSSTPATVGVSRKTHPHNDKAGPPPETGPVMNIRVRYTLVKSDKTPFLAHTAAHALHNYIVEHCTNGWIKLNEWTLPVEDDHYLYYQFQCADR